MHSLFPTQRSTTNASRHYVSGAPGQRCVAQPAEAPPAGSLPAESSEPARWMGYRRESSRGRGNRTHANARTGTPTTLPEATSPGSSHGGPVKSLMLALIRFYQTGVSPALPSSCRYYPSCSAYAYEAVEKRGVGRGIHLAMARLLRCRPWGGCGYDPVP